MESPDQPILIDAVTKLETDEGRSVGQPRHPFRRAAWHLARALLRDEGLNHEEDDR